MVSPFTLLALGSGFLVAEVITVAVSAFAVSDKKHRYLIPWVPTMHFYFPMATLASYKAVYELLTQPFYWDKTTHGVFERTQDLAETQPE
ncbi:hypothetical protein JI58_05610 [Marinosulfonomonas sp. PRT-SC04]|nr:hypothetical protein JI58_05610 [Marinosulfonomonas sp. PRT-SC04]